MGLKITLGDDATIITTVDKETTENRKVNKLSFNLVMVADSKSTLFFDLNSSDF